MSGSSSQAHALHNFKANKDVSILYLLTSWKKQITFSWILSCDSNQRDVPSNNCLFFCGSNLQHISQLPWNWMQSSDCLVYVMWGLEICAPYRTDVLKKERKESTGPASLFFHYVLEELKGLWALERGWNYKTERAWVTESNGKT